MATGIFEYMKTSVFANTCLLDTTCRILHLLLKGTNFALFQFARNSPLLVHVGEASSVRFNEMEGYPEQLAFSCPT